MGKAETQDSFSEDFFSGQERLVVVEYRGEKIPVPKSVLDATESVINCRYDGSHAELNGEHIVCTAPGYCLKMRGNGKRICTHWDASTLMCVRETAEFAEPLNGDVYCTSLGCCPNHVKDPDGTIRCRHWTYEEVKKYKMREDFKPIIF